MTAVVFIIIIITVHKQKYKMYDTLALAHLVQITLPFIHKSLQRQKSITTVHILPDLPVLNFSLAHHAQCCPRLEISRIKTKPWKIIRL